MNRQTVCLLCAFALVAGCKAQPPANQANPILPSAETRNAANAAPPSGQQALAVVKQRADHMDAFGDATKKAHNALQSSSPDVAAIREAAAQMNDLAPRLLSWFPKGTAVGVGKSRAKPEIWQKPEDFALKAHDLEQAANEFEVAATRGDLRQINATFAALGKACKACHDLYRAPKKD